MHALLLLSRWVPAVAIGLADSCAHGPTGRPQPPATPSSFVNDYSFISDTQLNSLSNDCDREQTPGLSDLVRMQFALRAIDFRDRDRAHSDGWPWKNVNRCTNMPAAETRTLHAQKQRAGYAHRLEIMHALFLLVLRAISEVPKRERSRSG